METADNPPDAPPAAPSERLVATSSPPPVPVSASAPGPTLVAPPGPGPRPPSSPRASIPADSLAALASHHPQQPFQPTPGPLPRPDESPLVRKLTPTPSPSSAAPTAANATPPSFYAQPVASPPPPRRDAAAAASTQAAGAASASAETNNTSRRTGPLSQQSRERAALIRKLGACIDCRRRRVACHPSHHNMTWEDVVNKFHRPHSPTFQDIAPSMSSGRPLSPAATQGATQQPMFPHDPQEMMDIDSNPSQSYTGRPSLNEARHRTPLPSGPRLEKSLSLPGIESLKNELQSSASRMLSTSTRSRYTAVHALLLFWQDDDDASAVHNAVGELADTLDNHYHFAVQTRAIPSSTADGSRNSWRWLSRELNSFAEERDQRDVLKIVYYVGQTYLDGNREMVLASSRDVQKSTTIRWNGIQQILEEARADTLIIMDAAYYPSSKMVRQTGVLELIAASMSADHQEALGCCAFTQALTGLLRTRANRMNPLSAAEVHAILFSSYPKMVRDQNPEKETIKSFPAPFHTLMSGNSRLPSIFLAPLSHASPVRTPSAHDNSPILHMSIRLNDDNVDLDIWNEWLRLMPEGVRDVKVEGPFKTTFR